YPRSCSAHRSCCWGGPSTTSTCGGSGRARRRSSPGCPWFSSSVSGRGAWPRGTWPPREESPMKRAAPALLIGAGVLVLGLSAADEPARRKAPAEPAPGKVITNSIGMKLAYIPAGKFRMGSPPGEAERDDSEVPHEVTISRPFYMGVYEVTQGEFNKVMGA